MEMLMRLLTRFGDKISSLGALVSAISRPSPASALRSDWVFSANGKVCLLTRYYPCLPG